MLRGGLAKSMSRTQNALIYMERKPQGIERFRISIGKIMGETFFSLRLLLKAYKLKPSVNVLAAFGRVVARFIPANRVCNALRRWCPAVATALEPPPPISLGS